MLLTVAIVGAVVVVLGVGLTIYAAYLTEGRDD
jgi:hypothetical protein